MIGRAIVSQVLECRSTFRVISSRSMLDRHWSVRDTYTQRPTRTPLLRCIPCPCEAMVGTPWRIWSATMELKNGAVVTYRRVTRRFFVASGFDGDNVFYDRCNFTGPSEKCVHIEYPKKDIRSWDKIVTRISLSLRG